jgi:2-polyprenyl-3-methyl-5-hydroxy-6-metoxy-1,4-benzoquinol methylase
VANSGYPERIVPDETEPGIVALHLKRYEFALDACAGKDVLDAACGVGYGTALLAREAHRVLGVDKDEAALAYARRRYGSDGAEFEAMDVTALSLPDDSFDVVCSFETLEHLDDPERAVAEAARVLRRGGTFFASTPHAEGTTRTPANPHHRIEYSPEDFERLLHMHFASVELFGQVRRQTRRHRLAQQADVLGLRRRLPFARKASSRFLGTHALAEVTAMDIEIVPGRLERATEVVAVCVAR